MLLTRLVALAVVLLLTACDSPDRSPALQAADPAPGSAQTSETATRAPSSQNTVELAADHSGHDHRPNERPLPAFGGRTLAGTRLDISQLIGKRLLLFFFNPEVKQIDVAARAVAEVAKHAQRNNFQVVGIGIGSTTSQVRQFARRTGMDFPIIDDSSGVITKRLRLQNTLLVIGADAEGYVKFVHPGFNFDVPDAQEKIADELRSSLRIASQKSTSGELLSRPLAPEFETEDIDGKPFSTAEFAGKPKIIMFFLHTCPHCHTALAFFKQQLPKIPVEKRPELIAISLQNRPSAVRIALADEGLDFFRVLVDPGQKLVQLYGLKGGVPDISLVNAKGEIVHRSRGWRDDRDPALMRMYLAKISEQKVPMLLSRTGYTGNDACVVCHEDEAASWEFTQHASAYDTLVTHSEERNPECVSCHVVGFGQKGGYSFDAPEPHLEGVGCENCHGRGGGHLGGGTGTTDYEATCKGCHNPEHSLGFDFAGFLPNVSHASIKGMTPEQRKERFAAGAQRRSLLPENTAYVGSDACRSCHESEFTTWAASPHAASLASLEAKGKASDDDCLKCHTTGFDAAGGFPKSAGAHSGEDLARVGCESCHGPGGEHVVEGAKRFGTIMSLGDKCDSCVILQICGSCHDHDNDANFEFEVQEHIERQRHGTTEAGSSQPIGNSAHDWHERSTHARLAEAFELLEPAS
jgi:peroxiredoxin